MLKNKRIKKQTYCPLIATVDGPITVNNEKYDQRRKTPEIKIISKTKRGLQILTGEATKSIVGANKDHLTMPHIPTTVTYLNQKNAKHNSPTKRSAEKLLSGIQDKKELARNSKKVRRNSTEFCSPTAVVTERSQMTKLQEVPSPQNEKQSVQKQKNKNSKQLTVDPVTNKEDSIEVPFSESPKLPLIHKEQETELERKQSISFNRDDPAANDELTRSLAYYDIHVLEPFYISENFDDKNMAYQSTSKLDKTAEQVNDNTHAPSETNSTEKRKDMQDSLSESVAKSTECSLPFSAVIPDNDSLMEGVFDVRY